MLLPHPIFTLLVSILIFFFYCSAAHRYLHSFPTRRSSDLEYPRLPRGCDAVIAEQVVACRPPANEQRPGVRQPDPVAHGSAKLVALDPAARQPRSAQAVAPWTDDRVVGNDDVGGVRRSDAALPE